MARAGETRFTLLQGAGQAQALYYREVFENTIQNYIPCLSRDSSSYQGTAQVFPGRVTRYLAEQLKPAAYDFYLCGGTEMIGDVMRIVDANFPGSRVYTEIFY
jgi:NAD(P)H-flavin reductase